MTAVGLEGLEHTVQLTHTWSTSWMTGSAGTISRDRIGFSKQYSTRCATGCSLTRQLISQRNCRPYSAAPTMSSGGPLLLLLHIPAGFRPSAALWNAITGAAKEVGRAAETGAGRFARSGPIFAPGTSRDSVPDLGMGRRVHSAGRGGAQIRIVPVSRST